ncbi:hypothetical protein OKW21_002008 [Catalinimonas alkaloidigena]|nr:hypothetical protein [Catalinimonas alkaloidigena]
MIFYKLKYLLFRYTVAFCCFLLTGSAYSQPQIREAKILDGRSNFLEVSFSENVHVSNADGFRLVGGAARIKSILGGSGSNQLIFSLTDFVLPDDEFSLLHWPELSDASSSSGRLPAYNNFSVDNQARAYHGKGNQWFVSTSGNDGFKGNSPQAPLRTIDKAQSLAQPGDYILLKRGDSFANTSVIIAKSGTADNYLSFSAYGNGPKPVLQHDSRDIFTVEDRDFVLIDNLHLKVRGNGETGVYIMGSSKYTVVANCRIEGIGSPHHGINYGKNDGNNKTVVSPFLLNNFITGFRWNIRSSGFPYDGTHEVRGGLIENNVCADNRATSDGDGISAQRGKYFGLIIRKNEIYGYYDDGIDLFSADNVIAEYNTVHSPLQPATSGQGIKAGGLTRADIIKGHQSTNITIRYNTVYNLYNKVNNDGSHNGIQTNSGSSGKVYGNVVYDVKGHGIVVSGPIQQWEVYNNTVVNAGDAGIRVWTDGSQDYNVKIYNNILQGKKGDIVVSTNTTKKNVDGKNNILLSGTASGNYSKGKDITAKINEIFVNPDDKNFSLTDKYKMLISIE